jgi:hypothetical protein
MILAGRHVQYHVASKNVNRNSATNATATSRPENDRASIEAGFTIMRAATPPNSPTCDLRHKIRQNIAAAHPAA